MLHLFGLLCQLGPHGRKVVVPEFCVEGISGGQGDGLQGVGLGVHGQFAAAFLPILKLGGGELDHTWWNKRYKRIYPMSKLMEEFLGNLRDKKIMARMVIKSISKLFNIFYLFSKNIFV